MSLTTSCSNDNIAYVGSMLYVDDISGNIIMLSKSYTSEKMDGVSTSPVFYEVNPYHKIAYYQLPETTAYYNINAPFFNDARKTFTYNSKFGERTSYIVQTEPRGLPTSISSSYSYATTKKVIESDEFLAGIVKDLREAMGEKQLNAAVGSVISDTVYNAVVAGGDLTRIYPDSPDPLVQWAVVATPLAVNTANCGYDIGFWITRDRTCETGSVSLDVITTADYGTISFAMDAYAQAMYNGITHNMFADEDYRSFLNNEYSIPLSYLENGTGGINSGQPIQGSYECCGGRNCKKVC